jgi:hypothetical protein
MASAAPVQAQPRPLAPGVLTVIPPSPEYEETYSGPIALVEIVRGMPELDWTPNFASKSSTVFERAKLAVLRRTVWNLEFSFKPLRMIDVDVPQPSGKMQRKSIWYMVYRIRYLGGDITPTESKDEWGHSQFDAQSASREGRLFLPRFILESQDLKKSYQDRIIPAAKVPIQDREFDGGNLLNSVEMSQSPIPLSSPEAPKEVWGLVTWEDVDPRVDFFSVYVSGLTNAYKPVDLPDGFKPGDPPGTGREFLSKTLRLNFWRPGDAILEHEGEIRYGIPFEAEKDRQTKLLQLYGLRERLDHLWVYR